MTVYKVKWYTPQHAGLIQGYTLKENFKIYTSKDKAEAYKTKLLDAAFLLLAPDVNPTIEEIKVED